MANEINLRRIRAHKARLAKLKLEKIHDLEVSLDLEHGLAYIYLSSNRKSDPYTYTVPDLFPSVNVDIAKSGRILGLEDISADLLNLSIKWVKALTKAKKKLEKAKKR